MIDRAFPCPTITANTPFAVPNEFVNTKIIFLYIDGKLIRSMPPSAYSPVIGTDAMLTLNFAPSPGVEMRILAEPLFKNCTCNNNYLVCG